MASAARNLFSNLHHSHSHSGERKSGLGLSRHKSNQESAEVFQSKKEEDKRLIASWEATSQKTPLTPGEVAKDPAQKHVGRSSKHLRCEDFKLMTTLGTGTSATLTPLQQRV